LRSTSVVVPPALSRLPRTETASSCTPSALGSSFLSSKSLPIQPLNRCVLSVPCLRERFPVATENQFTRIEPREKEQLRAAQRPESSHPRQHDSARHSPAHRSQAPRGADADDGASNSVSRAYRYTEMRGSHQRQRAGCFGGKSPKRCELSDALPAGFDLSLSRESARNSFTRFNLQVYY
jgi:hypothetical protein